MSTEAEVGELAGESGAQRQASEAAAIIADPGALGLGAFAATTMVLSCFNAGLLPTAGEHVVVPLALLYGGLVQLLAGMWEFRKGNTFGATAFSSYGAFWASFALYVQYIVPTLGGTEQAAPYTGVYLLAWTIFTVLMTVASARTNGALLTVFVLLSATFLLLTLGEFGVGTATAGGFVGLVTAVAAWYTAAAVVTNSTWGRVVLPVGPRS